MMTEKLNQEMGLYFSQILHQPEILLVRFSKNGTNETMELHCFLRKYKKELFLNEGIKEIFREIFENHIYPPKPGGWNIKPATTGEIARYHLENPKFSGLFRIAPVHTVCTYSERQDKEFLYKRIFGV